MSCDDAPSKISIMHDQSGYGFIYFLLAEDPPSRCKVAHPIPQLRLSGLLSQALLYPFVLFGSYSTPLFQHQSVQAAYSFPPAIAIAIARRSEARGARREARGVSFRVIIYRPAFSFLRTAPYDEFAQWLPPAQDQHVIVQPGQRWSRQCRKRH